MQNTDNKNSCAITMANSRWTKQFFSLSNLKILYLALKKKNKTPFCFFYAGAAEVGWGLYPSAFYFPSLFNSVQTCLK